jgi:hypothetical protein
MIIIEGMDNSGKSTLAQFVAKAMNLTIQESEGPPQSAEEFYNRLDRYDNMPPTTLFVRHPLVSNPIYDSFRPPETRIIIPATLYRNLYNADHLFVYCDPLSRGMEGHQLKSRDTINHITGVHGMYHHLLELYREWAFKHAHIIYRIGDDMNRTLNMIAGGSPYEDYLRHQHEKNQHVLERN